MTNKILSIGFLFINQLSFAQTDFANVVDYYNQQKNFNGTVLVATNGKIEYLSGVGISNRQNNLTINSKSKFKIASITKTFTAVLILKLNEIGKIDLSAFMEYPIARKESLLLIGQE